MDIILSLVGMAVLAIFFLPITAAIVLTSRGSVFFKQTRLGREEKTFTLLKFRTMRRPIDGEIWQKRTVGHDPRVTLVGSLLRKSYLDELPQFLNVFLGSMSLVGPRPEIPILAESIKAQHPRFGKRLSVKPGITGPAQLFYKHADNDRDAWRRYYYDSYYMKHCSLLLDMRLVAATLLRVARYRGQ